MNYTEASSVEGKNPMSVQELQEAYECTELQILEAWEH